MDFETLVESLLQPIADEIDVDILKISLGGGGGSQLLRVVVDRAGGVDSDDLERISRALALQMDVEDLIKGAYRLEVTSPGLEWPLESAADFNRYRDEWIKVFYIDGTTMEGRNLGPAESEAESQEGLCFRLREEDANSARSREHEVMMRDVSKVVRAINWKDVSRKGKKLK